MPTLEVTIYHNPACNLAKHIGDDPLLDVDGAQTESLAPLLGEWQSDRHKTLESPLRSRDG